MVVEKNVPRQNDDEYKCRWLCSMCDLACSPINSDLESPEAWRKIGCFKVRPSPSGHPVGRRHHRGLRQLLRGFPQEGHRENDTSYRLHHACGVPGCMDSSYLVHGRRVSIPMKRLSVEDGEGEGRPSYRRQSPLLDVA